MNVVIFVIIIINIITVSRLASLIINIIKIIKLFHNLFIFIHICNIAKKYIIKIKIFKKKKKTLFNF